MAEEKLSDLMRTAMTNKLVDDVWKNLDTPGYDTGRSFIDDCLYFGFKGFRNYTDAELIEVFNKRRLANDGK
jgi:hypothetical protein